MLLSSSVDKATNPANRDENWDFIMAFCDQVNKELEGPQIAVRLLAHKIQSPQDRESLYALSVSLNNFLMCASLIHHGVRVSSVNLNPSKSCISHPKVLLGI